MMCSESGVKIIGGRTFSKKEGYCKR